jgi:hypothetical protein
MSIIVLPNLNVFEVKPSVAESGGTGTSPDDTTTMFTAEAVPESIAPAGMLIAIGAPVSPPACGTLNAPPVEGRITETSSAERPAGTITGIVAGSTGTAVDAGGAGRATTEIEIIRSDPGTCEPLTCTACTPIWPEQELPPAVKTGDWIELLLNVPQLPALHT